MEGKNKYIASVLLGAIILGMGGFWLFSASAQAAVGINRQINFQGKVTNTDGTNVANGNYTFLFCLYTTGSPATACTSGANNDAVWRESKSITVTDGIFQSDLGDTTALPGSVDFNTDNIYLGINFNANGQMTPLVRFTAAPYAMNADKVHGLTVTDTTGTLTIASGKTVSFADAFTTSGAFATTLTVSGITNATLPSGTITLADLATGQTLTNKTIGSTGLVFSGASADITTATDEDLTLSAAGTGVISLNDSVSITGTSLTATSATTVTLGSTGADAITIGNGGADTITIGNVASTGVSIVDNNWSVTAAGVASFITGSTIGSQTFTTNNIADSGALTIASGTASALTLNSGTTGTINIGTDASAETINIGNTGAAVKTIAIGNNSQANTITIGDASATSVSITDNSWSITAAGVASFASATISGALAANGGITFDAATDTVGAHTLSGAIDANTNILENIGNTGTDFIASTGALTLAGVLTANGGISLAASQSLTGGAASFIDLASVTHGTTANQGFRLPQAASATPSNPTSGEGYIAWDAAGNQLIMYNGTSWSTLSGGGMSIGGSITSATEGSILFAGPSGALAQNNAQFFWDNTNYWLGLGDATPTNQLDLLSSAAAHNGIILTNTNAGNYNPIMQFELTENTPLFTLGVDDSDGDKFKISTGADISGTSQFTIDSTGVTTIANLNLGAMSFDTNAGIVSWMDMPVTSSATAGTVESYTAQIDGNALLTVYAESDGAGSIQNSGVSVGSGTLQAGAKFAVTQTSTSTTAGTMYNSYLSLSDTGIVTTGTDTTYGESIAVTRTGATGGTITTYGQNISVTGDAAGAGTSTVYGLRVAVSGADTNYAAAFTGGNVGIGTATPNAGATLHVDGTNTTAYLSYYNGGNEYGVYGEGGNCGGGQCVGIYGTTTSNPNTSAQAGYFGLANTNGIGVLIRSGTATTGTPLAIAQYTSAFTGTAMLANMAAGSGSFTGAFLDFQKNSVSQFMIDDNGDTTLGLQADLRFADLDSTNWVALQAPDTVTSNVTWKLPSADASGCLQSNGSGVLSIASCGGVSSTNWDTIGDAAASGAIAMAEYAQTMDWNTAATAAAFDGLTVTLTNDATTDTLTQRAFVVANLNDSAATGTTETIMQVDNRDADETVGTGLLVENTGAGTMTDAIKILETAGTITTAINIGNNVTTGISIGTGVTTGISIASGGITSTGETLLTNTGTGLSFRVNDVAADTTPMVVDADGNVGIGTAAPSRALDVFQAAAAPQLRLSKDLTYYSEFTVDAVGDLQMAATGSDIRALSENLWVCDNDACPALTLTGDGNIFVENVLKFGNGVYLKNDSSTELTVYDANDQAMLVFDQL